jgi:hypothetical protein
MSKLYVGFFVIASMLALSGFGFLGLVLITNLIWWFLPTDLDPMSRGAADRGQCREAAGAIRNALS